DETFRWRLLRLVQGSLSAGLIGTVVPHAQKRSTHFFSPPQTASGAAAISIRSCAQKKGRSYLPDRVHHVISDAQESRHGSLIISGRSGQCASSWTDRQLRGVRRPHRNRSLLQAGSESTLAAPAHATICKTDASDRAG